MKVYWEYRCDFGHSWEIFKEETGERKGDTYCEFGHEAVTIQKCRPVDEVIITIQPAGRVVDDVKNTVYPPKKYWLIIRNNQYPNKKYQSKNYYSWLEIRDYINRFQGVSFEKALQVMETLKL